MLCTKPAASRGRQRARRGRRLRSGGCGGTRLPCMHSLPVHLPSCCTSRCNIDGTPRPSTFGGEASLRAPPVPRCARQALRLLGAAGCTRHSALVPTRILLQATLSSCCAVGPTTPGNAPPCSLGVVWEAPALPPPPAHASQGSLSRRRRRSGLAGLLLRRPAAALTSSMVWFPLVRPPPGPEGATPNTTQQAAKRVEGSKPSAEIAGFTASIVTVRLGAVEACGAHIEPFGGFSATIMSSFSP